MRDTAPFDKNLNSVSAENGNAMIYILVALALVGFLTVTMTRQNNQDDGQDINEEVANLYISEVMEYASSVEHVVELMIASGSSINDLDFITPNEATFNTGSNIHKVFHPQGGGMNYEARFNKKVSAGTPYQWFIQDNLNVEWTPTTATDPIIIAYNVREDICGTINMKITGLTTIPAATVELEEIFDPDNATEASFNSSNCPGCDGHTTLCLSNPAADIFGYYSIIAGQ